MEFIDDPIDVAWAFWPFVDLVCSCETIEQVYDDPLFWDMRRYCNCNRPLSMRLSDVFTDEVRGEHVREALGGSGGLAYLPNGCDFHPRSGTFVFANVDALFAGLDVLLSGQEASAPRLALLRRCATRIIGCVEMDGLSESLSRL